MEKDYFHQYIASIAGITAGFSVNLVNEYPDWLSLVENASVGGLLALGTGIISYNLIKGSNNKRLCNGYQDARDFMIGFIATDLIFKGLENLVL